MSSGEPPCTDRAPAGCDVLLVVMPFGPLLNPSLGLSLLKASLGELRARIDYLTLPFADLIGADLYQWITLGAPSEWLLGDWIFAGALYGDSREDGYLDRVIRGHGPHPPADERRLDELRRARRLAGPFLESCRERIARASPRIVGFTNAFAQQTASLALARSVKNERPETFILFGGANCEGVMGREIVRQFPFVDAAVSGEGDRVFPQLCRLALDGQPVGDLPGVVTRDRLSDAGSAPQNAPPVQDMDALPYPEYDDFFSQWEASETGRRLAPFVLFETSRGCWWGNAQHCTFCGLNGSTMAFRSKSPERAFAELAYLSHRYPDRFILAVDTILDVRYFATLIPELIRSPLPIDLFYALKGNLRKDQIRSLRDAGITWIQPGVESLDDDILKLMRKGETGLQNIQLLKWCQELGVRTRWNFLWGFPGEPVEAYEQMARLVPLLTHLSPPQNAGRIRLERFSPSFELGTELGFVDIEPSPAYWHIYPFEPEALHNLAYHFAFRYADGRDVNAYTRPLAREIERWRSVYSESRLLFESRGEELRIWDLRPVASELLTVLTGLERFLVLACDRIRSLERLVEEAEAAEGRPVPVEEIEERLQPLLDRGLMIRQGDRLLSLAIAAHGDGDGANASVPGADVGALPPSRGGRARGIRGGLSRAR
jgi:ribosomal peptide maturation radical SAM protein 1